MKKRHTQADIEIVKGDIANQPDLDAIVNAANARLQTGGGVAGAIHQKAGPELAEKCQAYAPIAPGEAVITDACRLPNQYVIHCLGPVYGQDKPEDKLLASCYQQSLKLADKNQVKSIGFPAISTGAFGFPVERATHIALETIKAKLDELNAIELIRLVLFSQNDVARYESLAEHILNKSTS